MNTCVKKCSIRIYIVHLALLAVLSAGWWGILYPEFSFSKDTFAVTAETEDAVKEEGIEQKNTEKKDVAITEMSGREAFFEILGAEPGKVEIRSRFLDEVLNIRGKENEQQRTHRDF